ncbi:MAG: hypothetical protein WCG25_00560 [bacterium]
MSLLFVINSFASLASVLRVTSHIVNSFELPFPYWFRRLSRVALRDALLESNHQLT